ncbi:MAG: histidine kinase [Ramlibacter sp.]|jgi:signal transduction histidine kinase|nr:histidine kinase [Ramlibacter sp.]MDB5912302.1 histidine kinase [Ramlibacter sp.]
MHAFLRDNRDALIARCKLKVSHRPQRAATDVQLANGVPLFLDQLTRTLEAEEAGEPARSLKISGAAGGDTTGLSEIGVSATAHGKDLLKLGFSVDQVVYDYGDLSQALAELAHERHQPFTTEEFRTLNRCVDNAIAYAVTAFSSERDAAVLRQQHADARERVGFLVHELRNALGTATLAASALELGNMTLSGATGAVLKRSLASLNTLITRSLIEVRSEAPAQQAPFTVTALVRDAEQTAQLDAAARGCTMRVPEVDPGMMVRANRELLQAALGNLIQNALKFTHANSQVTVSARASGDRVLIEVEDHCGGLPAGSAQRMFSPFNQLNDDKSGLGIGLSIARQSIEADSGTLGVRDVPGIGCVFTISLPLVQPALLGH